MTGGTSITVVNFWNEWGLLKHVIVGRAEGGHVTGTRTGYLPGFFEGRFPPRDLGTHARGNGR